MSSQLQSEKIKQNESLIIKDTEISTLKEQLSIKEIELNDKVYLIETVKSDNLELRNVNSSLLKSDNDKSTIIDQLRMDSSQLLNELNNQKEIIKNHDIHITNLSDNCKI